MCSDNPDSPGGSGPDGNRRTFDWDGFLQPSTAVVEAVATVTGRDATELEPIHRSVDADALDNLVDPGGNRGDNAIQISFRYEGVDILLDKQHGIEIRSIPDGDEMGG
jgi:hypothetical protein